MERTPARRGEQGMTLVPALMISLLLMATSASMTSTALHRYAAERVRSEEELAYHMAESGLDVGLYELQSGADLSADGIGAATGALTGGGYVTSVTPAFVGAGTYTLSSVGTVGQRQRTMQMVVVCTISSGVGMTGLSSISLSGSSSIDSYDSTLGTYASQVSGGHAGGKGNIASNGNISASGSGAIYGDATPGPGKIYSGSFSVTGSTAPATKLITANPYVYSPPGPAATNAYSGTAILTAGTYHYTSFSMASKNTLTAVGSVTIYVDGSFDMTGQSQINIPPGSKVVIHQGNADMKIAGGGIANVLQQPSDLQIFSASTTTMKYAGTSAFYGVMYAPKSDFFKNGNADFFGAVVSNTVSIVGNGWMHYDTSLAGPGTPTMTVAMVRGW